MFLVPVSGFVLGLAFPRNPREFRVCDKFYFDRFGLRHGQLRLVHKSRYASRVFKGTWKNVMRNNKGGNLKDLGAKSWDI